MFDLVQKKIVVTGAAQGNGEAIAKKLAQLGATVILADMNYEKLQNVKNEIETAGGRAYAFALNVAEQQCCQDFAKAVYDTIGDIDVLVNNAGILRRSNFAVILGLVNLAISRILTFFSHPLDDLISG